MGWVRKGGLRGPQGERGPQGAQGPKGDPGATEWGGIGGKPSAYPPEPHSHSLDEVGGVHGAARIYAGELSSEIDRNGHLVLWTNDQFQAAFGDAPSRCAIAVNNRAAGGSGIFLATPRWNGTAVYSTAMSVSNGVVAPVAGNGTKVPVCYIVAVLSGRSALSGGEDSPTVIPDI